MNELTRLIKSNLESRVQVYDLLRRIFLTGPSLDLLRAIVEQAKSKPLQEDFQFPEEEAFFDFLRQLTSADLEPLQKELTWEFNRLFVGPYHLPTPPYESVYRTTNGLMMQEPSTEVRKKFLAAGLQVTNLNRDPDDHIGLELEFMYFLCVKGLQALENNRIPELRLRISQQQEFLEIHLLQWALTFCEDVSGHTHQPFFARMAGFMAGYFKLEKQIIKETLLQLENH
ncbi:MAG TPA: molecular chaperone TorD family protein [Desulfitobacterium dehalogenans]|uniref:Molecular chaperone TorD family protein n=1 Tax=Desulfitobacterium dehalogenans TaxID=36854 RepID=A0A7C7D9H5_9FIRM|nr:molecular chaperone TorD family protein [Desulfitobacterium dehalogenans]